MPAGLRIIQDFPRPASRLIAAFAGLGSSQISDAMERFGVPRGLRFLGREGTGAVGPALTVKVSPADNLLLHKAVDILKPGDILVVDTGGDESRAVIGDLMGRRAQIRGLAGLVVDGLVRDVASLRTIGLPVWARGATPAGPYKHGPGEIGVAVSIGGVAVHPGDIIAGDDDGIVCVPLPDAESVLAAARQIAAKEEKLWQSMASGSLSEDRSWVDRALADLGCEYPGQG
ncbi:MAG: RraA family protein [Thermaerobacterales bacterium]